MGKGSEDSASGTAITFVGATDRLEERARRAGSRVDDTARQVISLRNDGAMRKQRECGPVETASQVLPAPLSRMFQAMTKNLNHRTRP